MLAINAIGLKTVGKYMAIQAKKVSNKIGSNSFPVDCSLLMNTMLNNITNDINAVTIANIDRCIIAYKYNSFCQTTIIK